MKRYYNEQENKYYYEGTNMTHRIGKAIWCGKPTVEQLTEWGYTEVIDPVIPPYVPTYDERVVALIRERYSLDAELAIQRQRETKPEEFAEYFDYCEECKRKAKEEEESA